MKCILRLFSVCCALLFFGKTQYAQTYVVPNAFATTDPNGTFSGPLQNSARSYQLLIDSSQLTYLIGKELTGFTFRSNASASTAWPNANSTYANYDVYLSGSVAPANRSLDSLKANVVGVQKQVRSGTLTIAAGSFPAGGVSSWGQVITFDSVYLYTGGHLLLQINHTGGNESRAINAVNATGGPAGVYGNQVSACWASAYAPPGALTQGNAAVVRFNYAVNTTPITSLTVATQGSVAPTITTNAGTLQMTATVLPAAASQTVNWAIVPGTGAASISTAGLITAQANGTVWAKATSATDNTKRDSMLITLSNQIPAITSVVVATQGSVSPQITTNAGTLQMVATILPAVANQAVTWSLVNGTGTGTISATGLVTAQSNGTVWAKAVSVQDASKRDSMQITITNQLIPITGINVATQMSLPPTITTNAGTLQMVATIIPIAANQSVTWSIVNGTGAATISTTGLVTAQSNGTVWAKAVSVQDANFKDSLLLTLSNQIVPITSLTVTTQGSVPATINTLAGTLQMEATILPATANQAVTWSIVPGTGNANISTTGLVTALGNGTVWAKAVSIQNTAMRDSMEITISNQISPVSSITVSTQGGVPATINTLAGTLQLVATVLPATANQNVSWSIVPGTGTAGISNSGNVTALTDGNIWAKATSVENANFKDSLNIEITNQGTSIQHVENNDKLEVYPNPVSKDGFSIQFETGFVTNRNITYLITDMNGRVMSQGSISQDKTTIQVQNWASGVYLLKLNGKNLSAYRSLIKE